MEEITKFHVDWKKIVVVGLLLVLTAMVSAGATWYVMDMAKDTELNIKDGEIVLLETRVAELEAEIAAEGEQDKATEGTSETTNGTNTESTDQQNTETETETTN